MPEMTTSMEICRGEGPGCRFSLCPASPESPEEESLFVQLLKKVVEDSGWPDFLREKSGGRIHHHNRFSIGIAACPNGCARPHIKDIGFIRARVPNIDQRACTSCGACSEICKESAIAVAEHGAEIDHDKCLSCGQCISVCPEAAMTIEQTGVRIVMGGRLGRHPRLATELSGIFSEQKALEILRKCLATYMDAYETGMRFAELVESNDKRLARVMEE